MCAMNELISDHDGPSSCIPTCFDHLTVVFPGMPPEIINQIRRFLLVMVPGLVVTNTTIRCNQSMTPCYYWDFLMKRMTLRPTSHVAVTSPADIDPRVETSFSVDVFNDSHTERRMVLGCDFKCTSSRQQHCGPVSFKLDPTEMVAPLLPRQGISAMITARLIHSSQDLHACPLHVEFVSSGQSTDEDEIAAILGETVQDLTLHRQPDDPDGLFIRTNGLYSSVGVLKYALLELTRVISVIVVPENSLAYITNNQHHYDDD